MTDASTAAGDAADAPPDGRRDDLAAAVVLGLVARTVQRAWLPLAGVVMPSAALWTVADQLILELELGFIRDSPLSVTERMELFPFIRLVLIPFWWILWAVMNSITAAIVIDVARDRRPVLADAVRRGLSFGFVAQLRLMMTTVLGALLCLFPGLVVLMQHYAVAAVAIGRELPHSAAWTESKRLTDHGRGLVLALAIIPPALRIATSAALPVLEVALDVPRMDAASRVLLDAIHGTVQSSTFVLDGLLAGALGAVAIRVDAQRLRGASLAATFE